MSGAFQTFYLLFKNNAKETQKDVDKLGAAVDQTEKKIKKTKEESVELGKAFTDAVEDSMRALAAYASFTAIKSGIINAQEFNRTLTIQTKLWGQNANEINAYGKAVKAAGGDTQALFGWYDQQRKQNAQQGRQTLPIGQLMDRIHNQVKGLSPEAAQMIFGMYGIGDPGAQSLLRSSDEDYMKAMASARELTSNTEAGSEASQAFGKAWDNLTGSLQKFWTTVNTFILPAFTLIFEGLTSIFNYLGNHKGLAVAFFFALVAGATAFTACIPAIVAGFSAIAAGAMAAAVPIALLLSRFAALVGFATWLPGASARGGAGIAHWINRRLGRGDTNGILPGHKGYTGPGSTPTAAGNASSVMDYLMTKHGLDAEHAAAIAANLHHESGFDPNARGDGGMAHGIAQWHPDRRAKILAGTGIDVSNSSREQQLDAIMWELKQRGQLDAFLAQRGEYNAAGYFSKNFEVPANGAYEAMRRGQTAIGIAGSTPFASQSSFGSSSGGAGSVSIGKIEVHTQATDADGIARDVGSAMQRQFGNVYAQNNDAMAY